MKRQRKPQHRPSRSCWLCDRIGHRWVTRQHARVDGMSSNYPLFLSHCARCGKPSPVQVREVKS